MATAAEPPRPEDEDVTAAQFGPEQRPTDEEPDAVARGWVEGPDGSRQPRLFVLAQDSLGIGRTEVAEAPEWLNLRGVNGLDALGDPADGAQEVEMSFDDGRVVHASWPESFCDRVVGTLTSFTAAAPAPAPAAPPAPGPAPGLDQLDLRADQPAGVAPVAPDAPAPPPAAAPAPPAPPPAAPPAPSNVPPAAAAAAATVATPPAAPPPPFAPAGPSTVAPEHVPHFPPEPEAPGTGPAAVAGVAAAGAGLVAAGDMFATGTTPPSQPAAEVGAPPAGTTALVLEDVVYLGGYPGQTKKRKKCTATLTREGVEVTGPNSLSFRVSWDVVRTVETQNADEARFRMNTKVHRDATALVIECQQGVTILLEARDCPTIPLRTAIAQLVADLRVVVV